MPRANLEFDLPEEESEFRTCVKAGDLAAAVWDYDQRLRSIVKYGDKNYTDAELDVVDRVRMMLWEYLNDHDISDDIFG